MEELGPEKFDNLDAWVPKAILPIYEKEILSKLLKKKKEEEKKQSEKQPDPFPIGHGGGPRYP